MILPVVITDRAKREIQKNLQEKNVPEGYGLRVGVRGSGCAGVSYLLGFDEKGAEDNEYDVEGIPIFIAKKDAMFLFGMKLDFYDGHDARGFTFLKIEEEKEKTA